MTTTTPTSTATATESAVATIPVAATDSTTPVTANPEAITPDKSAIKPPVKNALAPAKKVFKTLAKPVAATSAKPAPQVAAKTVAKPNPVGVPKLPVKTPEKRAIKAVLPPTAIPKLDKLLKAKKPKLVRDSFTIPKLEFLILDELKHRSGKLGNSVKKSELIRAGIKALAAMSDASFLAALKAVPTIKTGRPTKD